MSLATKQTMAQYYNIVQCHSKVWDQEDFFIYKKKIKMFLMLKAAFI